MKSLVIYYSRTGTTRFVAEKIAAELGSDIEEVVDLKSREGKLGWMSAGMELPEARKQRFHPLTKFRAITNSLS